MSTMKVKGGIIAMPVRPRVSAESLGIDLPSHQESQLFRWFLACLLFGKPIRQEIASKAYFAITDAGITSLRVLAGTTWNMLVSLLDGAHYVRYDFSTATKLREIAHDVKTSYGTVGRLVRQAKDPDDLEIKLRAFKGIGPVTASLFVREIAPYWFDNKATSPYDIAIHVADTLYRHGFEAYIVGGAVRDLMLGHEPKDFDVSTDATPAQIAAIADFEHVSYTDTAQAYGVSRVRIEDSRTRQNTTIEIATFRKDIDAHKGRKATRVAFAELEDDVLRRDFTINALALEPELPLIIDLVGGMDDLDAKLIRFIGAPADRLREDPLRLLRAIRFKNQLGFSYHTATYDAIKRAVAEGAVQTIATDRLRDELTKMLMHPSRQQAILDLDELGILEQILPELTAGKGIEQPYEFHAEGDVWHHQLVILNLLPTHPHKRLAWAALLHDIGKAATRREPLSERDRVRFNRHYAVGAEMAKAALGRLNFSKHDIREIAWMIYHHIAIDDLPRMRPSHQQRMMGHPAFGDLLELHKADAAASWREGKRNVKPKFVELETLWREYQSAEPDVRQPSLKRDLGIDGHWLQERFRELQTPDAGPLIGRILAALNEWYRDERIQDISQYETKARELIAHHSPVQK